MGFFLVELFEHYRSKHCEANLILILIKKFIHFQNIRIFVTFKLFRIKSFNDSWFILLKIKALSTRFVVL